MEINAQYLGKETQRKIKKIFLKEKKVILFNFLDGKSYLELKPEIQKLKFRQEKEPLTHCYSRASIPSAFQEKLMSKEFVSFIQFITNTKNISWKPDALQFSWKEYTILHDNNKEKPEIDIIFDFTDDWNPKAGGAVTYVDGTGNYTKLPIQGNMLAIVQRSKNEQKFVQYVNHYGSDKNRRLLTGSF